MADWSYRLLTADLASGVVERRSIESQEVRAYLGGGCLAARLLYRHLVKELDALAPQAPLCFLTGPLTGTGGPSVGRHIVAGKSPATGGWGESNCGGFFGHELRAAGYDGLLLTGRAASPVYLWITDGEVELRPADHLWGSKDTYGTIEAVRGEVGDQQASVAAIGLAGEVCLQFACIISDHGRAAGRTGLGAVMGSKKLKAIGVRGHQKLPIVGRRRFNELARELNRSLLDDPIARALHQAGTASCADYYDYWGTMVKRYFTRGVFEGAGRITGTAIADTILTGVSACHGCVIRCGRRVRLGDGVERKGPEYEALSGFGSNLEIDDPASVTRISELCDRYGMDVISVSNIIGLALLLFEKGFLSLKDTGGMELEWGNVGVVESLVHRIARGEGVGELLRLGAKALAEHCGAPGLATEVKGLEMAYHDPRGASGMALVYATSPCGASHTRSDYYMVDMGLTAEELGIEWFDRHAGKEKAGNVARHQDWRTAGDSLVMCSFPNVALGKLCDLLNAATGLDYTLPELMQVGERAWNLKRLINRRLGFGRADDRLPELVLRPLEDGGAAGYVPPIDEMLRAYYEARGWDVETGMPSRERLVALGLEELAGK